jgi:ActR/RegA family two-component response regulator
MHHVNPKTISLLLTGFPGTDVAAKAILRQAVEILLKDSDFEKLAELIKRRIAKGTTESPRKIESVATILGRVAPSCTDDWFFGSSTR